MPAACLQQCILVVSVIDCIRAGAVPFQSPFFGAFSGNLILFAPPDHLPSHHAARFGRFRIAITHPDTDTVPAFASGLVLAVPQSQSRTTLVLVSSWVVVII